MTESVCRRAVGTHPNPSGPACVGEGSRTAAAPPPESALPSFKELYDSHFEFVWRSLRGLGVASGSVDDALQDTFLVAYRRLAEFEGRASPKTWLFSIAMRVAANYRRRERRKGGHLSLDAELEAAGGSPVAELESARAWGFVSRFLESVSEAKRRVFILCLWEGMSAPEAAEALEIPVNTVYSRLHSVREEFRRALARAGQGVAP